MRKKINSKLKLKQTSTIFRGAAIALTLISVVLLLFSNNFLNDYTVDAPRHIYAQLSLVFALIPLIALVMGVLALRREYSRKSKIAFIFISIIALFLALKLLLNGFAVNFLS